MGSLKVLELAPGFAASIFASKEWIESNYDSGFLLSDGRLWLAVALKKQLFWTWAQITQAPTSVQSGEKHDASEEQVFLEAVVAYLRGLKIDFIRQPPTHVHFKSVPSGAASCLFGSFAVDLTQDENVLWDRVHQKHRNVIRKAEKDGVVIEYGAHLLPECLELLRQTLLVRSKVGMHPEPWFSQMMEQIPENVLCVIARYQGVAHGAAFLPWNKQGCYYLYGGSCDKPHGGAMNLLHWQTMLLMKSRGVKSYDFVGARINPDVGSKYEGMQRFKERFGSDLHQGFLWKIDLHPFRAKIYHLLQAWKRKSDLGDVIDQETRRHGVQGGK